MGIATTVTKLSLADFARVLGINPRHFHQIEYTPPSRSAVTCDGGLFQYDWQSADRVSREQVAEAILDAEAMIEPYLQYRLAPSWETEEWQLAPRPYQRELVTLTPYATTRLRSSVEARWKNIISGGSEARTLLEAGVAITWISTHPDAGAETGMVEVEVADYVDPCEVELYYPGHDGEAAYQIRPVNVAIVAGLATITFARYLVVHPELLESYDPQPAQWDADDDFLGTVDVYRHWNDPSRQALLMWEPGSYCGCTTAGSCSACSYAVQEACLFLRSTPREGMFAWAPGEWDPEVGVFRAGDLAMGRGPDVLRLFYYAGHVAPAGCPSTMDRHWQNAVARLAVTLLDRPACECTSSIWDHWQQQGGDLGKGDAAVRYLSNPFGTSRGALYAWSRVVDPGVGVARSAALV
jgi:hypothetical protein